MALQKSVVNFCQVPNINDLIEQRSIKLNSLFTTKVTNKDDTNASGVYGRITSICCGNDCNFILKEIMYPKVDSKTLKLLNKSELEYNNDLFWSELEISFIMGENGIGPKIYDYIYESGLKYNIIMEKLDLTFNQYINKLYQSGVRFPELDSNWIQIEFGDRYEVLFRLSSNSSEILNDAFSEINKLSLEMWKLGYTHGDLHGGNIMTSTVSAGNNRWKLIDFGKSEKIINKDKYFPVERIATRIIYSDIIDDLDLNIFELLELSGEESINLHSNSDINYYIIITNKLNTVINVMNYINKRCNSIPMMKYASMLDRPTKCNILFAEHNKSIIYHSCLNSLTINGEFAWNPFQLDIRYPEVISEFRKMIPKLESQGLLQRGIVEIFPVEDDFDEPWVIENPRSGNY